MPRWLLDKDGPIALSWRYFPRAFPWLWRFLAAGQEHRVEAIADAMLRINQPVITLYRQLLAGGDDAALIRDAHYVYCFQNPHRYNPDSPVWRMRRERGVPMTVYREGEVREFEAALSENYRVAVAIGEQGYCVNPGAMGKRLAARVARQGGDFRYGDIKRIVPKDNGFKLVASGREFFARRLVVCAGAFSQRLLAPLGIDTPLETERGYHLMIKDPGVTISNAITDAECAFAATPMHDGDDACLRIAGTTEFAGLDAPPNPRRTRMLKRLSKRMFPDLNLDRLTTWMGHRPALPDSLPVIDRVGQFDNLYASFGHGHLGVTGAPMTGRLLAAIIDGDRPDVDLAPYRHDRF